MNCDQRLIVLIGGCAGHGKDSFADYLEAALSRRNSIRKDAYAYTIKKLVHDTLGVPWEILNANKDVKESAFVQMAGVATGVTVRQCLQKIGEFYRQTFGTLVWADSVLRRFRASSEQVTIVTDARHPKEEIHWIKDQVSDETNVIVIRVRNPRVPIKRGHPSEDYIADEPDSSFDIQIENDSGLPELQVKAVNVASTIP